MKGFLKNVSLLLLFFIIFVLSQFVVSVVVSFAVGDAVMSDRAGMVFMATYFFSMFLCYVLTTILERVACRSVTPIDHSKRGYNPVAILTGVVLLIAISIVLTPLNELLPANTQTFPEGPLSLVTIVIIAPIFEEMIFRGRLYNILHHNGSPLSSTTLSALAFGLVHLQPVVIINALIVGVVLSYFYIVRRSIVAPIILHMCNNAIAYALLVLSYRGESLISILDDWMTITVTYSVSAAIVVICAIIIFRRLFIERRNERRAEVEVDEDEIDE